MAIFGPDFRGGLAMPLYRPDAPAGTGWAVAAFIILVVANQLLQLIFGLGFHVALSDTAPIQQLPLRPFMIALFPAGLATAFLAWTLASVRGGRPKNVLALRFPALGVGGWLVVLMGFLLGLYALIALAVHSLSIDTSTQGLVEKAMAALVHDPAYGAMVLGIVIGAPLAEELTFRGQIFAALSKTRLRPAGTAVLTSLVWAGIHVTEPLYAIALIFVMGLALSTLLIRFGSLWVTFACHAVWNGVYSFALFALPQT
jgi:membrane protease YdiL (CAAX protease family)